MVKKNLLLVLFIIMAIISACSNEDSSTIKSNNNQAVSKVTVWFDTQQESILNWYQTIDMGTVIAKPNDLFLDNYTFLGWYDSNVNGNLWDFSRPVLSNMTLYAVWQKNDGSSPEIPAIYTVSYDNGGMGGTVESIQLQSGTILYDSHLPVLSADGYIFQGWYYNNEKVVAGQFRVTSDIKLTAKWIANDTGDTTPPADVTDLKVSSKNNQAVLTWVNPQDNDFKTVEVSYKSPDESATYINDNSKGAGQADTFTIPKIIANISDFTFTVKAVDYNGNKSNGVSVKSSGETINPDPEPEPEPEPEPDFSEYKNRVEWFYGIQGPMPNDDAWVQPVFKEQVLELPWNEKYGWYDVNKTHLVDKENKNTIIADDNELCWAATSSNILHWWFRLNDKYIKKYDEINPAKKTGRPDSKYPNPNMNIASASKYQESAIFQYYIDHFEDKAGWADAGINWFISGEKPTQPTMTNSNGGGFFDDVFPKGKYIATKVQGLSKEVFTATIIDAIEGHKMIGLAAKVSSTNHLMTVWGAEFDENGYVKAIYLADNNVEQTTKPYTKDLTKRLINYETYSGTSAGYTEMSTYWAEVYTPIYALITVDLGVQQWEDYFKNKGVEIK